MSVDNPYQPPSSAPPPGPSVSLQEAVRYFTRGTWLIRTIGVLTMVIGAGALLFLGPAAREGARGAAIFAASAIGLVLTALQGAALWTYSSRLYALRRAPSEAGVTEALKWLRYALVVFVVSGLFSLAGEGLGVVVASTVAVIAASQSDALARESRGLRGVLLIGIALMLVAAVVELRGGVSKLLRSSASELPGAIGELIGALAVQLGFSWLSWRFAQALGALASAPTVGNMHAAGRAYAKIITLTMVMAALVLVFLVVTMATGDTSWLPE